ncbi:PREDICTED: outer envelope pore protein 37, chloroplastic [Nicotiana attenuata]|uniref:Outer envelope pore protein 37, chloroplastic n=1 Tax=Nicotiana attenuata TaxID=49451 RepID=A0A314L3B7_NICAT|nr:PREDICTED: outer envelope pore protein 37, chloroplastic [Nicotiana attenuata]OIT35667.1 outer envelope pore protein 37, chloroplastic [Nicotiana attenuata]
MAESELELKSPPNPNSLIVSAPLSAPPESPPATAGSRPIWLRQRPKIRVTTEFDSDSSVFFHRISCKVLDSFAKLKLSFQNNGKGEISDPQLALSTKYLSLQCDIEEKNALVNASFGVAPGLQFKAAHDVKSQQGELAMVADLAGPAYKFELSSAYPSIGMPRATIKFPLGEVSLQEKEEEEEEQAKRILSVNGILKGNILNGVCTAKYNDETLDLRYCYKDEQMAFIPSISLPSNAMSFAFKRRFGPSDKLSYWYNLDTNYWSTVYKHNIGKDFKFKAGYDSEVRLGWASLWAGEEAGKAKTAPMKMKVQFMLQVPQDDITSSSLMFRVKKRWDI